jgi:hypothetical protein
VTWQVSETPEAATRGRRASSLVAVDATKGAAEVVRWIESVSSVDSVTVSSIAWALTDARTSGVTAEVRSRAVNDAVAKASVYAQSMRPGSVTAVAIADPGGGRVSRREAGRRIRLGAAIRSGRAFDGTLTSARDPARRVADRA